MPSEALLSLSVRFKFYIVTIQIKFVTKHNLNIRRKIIKPRNKRVFVLLGFSHEEIFL